MQRLFVAIPLTANEAIAGLLSKLKKELRFSQINWVKPENLHITLRFIGETSELKRIEISKLLQQLVPQHQSFQIDLNRTGIFGSRYNPRVIWLGGTTIPEELKNLTQSIDRSFETIGFARDRQNFVPHLTLGRIKSLSDKSHFQKIVQDIEQKTYLQEKVGNVVLFESILKKEGPTYKIIETYGLNES